MVFTLRFQGFALILNTLLPFVLGTALIVLGAKLITQAEHRFKAPAAAFFADMDAALNQTRQGITQVAASTTAIQSEMNLAGKAVQALIDPLTNFNVTLPPVPLTVPSLNNCLLLSSTPPRWQRPAQARIYKAQGLFEDPIGSVRRGVEDVGRAVGDAFKPKDPFPPSDVTPLPGRNQDLGRLRPTLDDCDIKVETIDLGAALAGPLNTALSDAFAVPRRQIAALNASITTTHAELEKVSALVRTFPINTQTVQAHRNALSTSAAIFWQDALGTLRIILWICAGVMAWVALSCGGWLAARVFLGWHLLRYGSYP